MSWVTFYKRPLALVKDLLYCRMYLHYEFAHLYIAVVMLYPHWQHLVCSISNVGRRFSMMCLLHPTPHKPDVWCLLESPLLHMRA